MERVNHPEHYGGDTTYEAIKVIEAWKLDFCLGNVVKYISRAGKKENDPMGDLLKAQWYLNRAIEQLKVIVPVRLSDQVVGIEAIPLCPVCQKMMEYEFGELRCENGHPPYKFVT